jgi:ribosomal protein L13E
MLDQGQPQLPTSLISAPPSLCAAPSLAARVEKAAKSFPRPAAGALRPVVHGQTVKYNAKLRQGRGFSLAELKVRRSAAAVLRAMRSLCVCAAARDHWIQYQRGLDFQQATWIQREADRQQRRNRALQPACWSMMAGQLRSGTRCSCSFTRVVCAAQQRPLPSAHQHGGHSRRVKQHALMAAAAVVAAAGAANSCRRTSLTPTAPLPLARPPQEAGVPAKLAPTLGISVDHRRRNRSLEGLQANVARIKAYRSNLVIFPRNAKKPRKFEVRAEGGRQGGRQSLAAAAEQQSSTAAVSSGFGGG